MHDRSAMGPADVDDDALARMVADLFRVGSVELVDSSAVEVSYAIPAITTGGRWWVTGSAVVDGQAREFTLFAKQVHEWSRSPFFETVPPEAREWAAQQVPWRTEGAVYRSDLGDRLPAGLATPRAVGVHDIDELSYSVWLEAVPIADVDWDLDRYRNAAHLLGRFAAADRVRELARIGGHEWDVRTYVDGRLRVQVLPMLADDDLWRHPLVASTFADLRPRLVDAGLHVDDIARELLAVPVLAGHGDACPNNLLVRPGIAGFTMIDFGFFTPLPAGFDLGQLLVGDVQIGCRTAEDLAVRDEACLASYREGLLAEGVEIELSALRRAHALQLVLFTALSALPFELLDEEPTEAVLATARTRAAVARYILDLVQSTV